MLNRLLIALTACLLTAAAGADPQRDLPDIGSVADTVFTRTQAEAIGRSVLRQLREQGNVLEDPEVAEYITDIGQRIASQAHDGEHRFEFFVVNDDAINAFALPGGYVGINSGLVTATRSESELAGVLAHEIAHVTQKHIARRIAGTGRTSILATAAVLAAILLGAGGDAIPAAIMSAQGLAIQEQINYTRANEYEADRIGLGFLARAEFDPMGMPSFFEVLSREAALPGSRVPEFLQTHPLSSNRIAETRDRAERTEARAVRESPMYDLMRARIHVLNARSADDALARFVVQMGDDPEASTPAARYGYGLALLRAGRHAEAVPVLQRLLDEDEATVVFHSALGEALILAGRTDEGLAVFEHAVRLFPRNRPLVVRYAEALLRTRHFQQAHAVLLDLFNVVRPTPPQVRLIASAADAAGQAAEALFYMSEYHLLTGQLPMALDKLRLALLQPDLQPWQRARFEARIAELEPYLKQYRASRVRTEQKR
ncbi:MAG TPA: M48 family metalloprotease [Gammaproteobacteria bacterium]|nr:M48 family metalloprotease [Gammaproteobacteria bacterium]HRP86893.1 M48 family metalloprotease [Gammaproteobacteria bacterium]